MKSGKTSSKLRYKGKKVLLLDGYGRQIPSLLHQLHELGCKVTTMCESRLDVGFTSRYPSRRIVVHGIREDVDIYRQAIEKELENGYDVLFPILEKTDEICGRDANGPQHQKIYQGGVSYSSGAVYDAGDCIEYCIHPLTGQHNDDVSSCQSKN